MFDIDGYYDDEAFASSFTLSPFSFAENAENIIEDIEEDIRCDIDRLLKAPFQSLYLTERYKFGSHGLQILYPALSCPERHSFILAPDKLRFSLSVHKNKEELKLIERIVIRPRYVKIKDVELTSLYMWDTGILILYLTCPETDSGMDKKINASGKPPFLSSDAIARSKAGELHPISCYISVIASGRRANGLSQNKRVEKFFLKRDFPDKENVKALEDISHFYSRHGY